MDTENLELQRLAAMELSGLTAASVFVAVSSGKMTTESTNDMQASR